MHFLQVIFIVKLLKMILVVRVLMFLLLSNGICLGLDICEWQEDGTYLAHPADCSKFVLCWAGMTAVIESCPIGFHFNRQLGICDYRVKAGCELNYNVLETVSSGSSCCCCSLSNCNSIYPTEAPPTKKPCSVQTTESTIESTIESTTGSTIECTREPTIESTTNEPTTESTTESTTVISIEPTMKPTTKSTIGSTPKVPTMETTIESTTNEPTTEPTIKATMEPTTEITIKPTMGPTTGSTMEPTTESTTPPTTEPITESTTGTSSEFTPTPTTVPNQKQNNPLCGNNLPYCYNFVGVRNILYPGDCRKYIVCVDGCATLMSCPSNLHFNPSYGYCDFQENVDCPYKEIEGALVCPSGHSCDDPGKCANQPEGTMLRDPDSNGFIICQCECEVKKNCPFSLSYNEELQVCDWSLKSVYIVKECPSDELYNELTGSCKPAGEFICDSSSGICANQTDGALFPVEGACNKFYGCLNGCAYELQCPENLIFNTTHKFCDNPEYTTCGWPYRPDFGATIATVSDNLKEFY